jgi:hypothetical protein
MKEATWVHFLTLAGQISQCQEGAFRHLFLVQGDLGKVRQASLVLCLRREELQKAASSHHLFQEVDRKYLMEQMVVAESSLVDFLASLAFLGPFLEAFLAFPFPFLEEEGAGAFRHLLLDRSYRTYHRDPLLEADAGAEDCRFFSTPYLVFSGRAELVRATM